MKVKISTTISRLAKGDMSIYKQIQVADSIKNMTKPIYTIWTSALKKSVVITYQ